MEHSPNIGQIASALAKAQGEFEEAERDRDNPFFGSTYSTMAAVLKACRAALAKYEIAVIQAAETDPAAEGKLLVDTMLVHSSGEFFRTKLSIKVMEMVVEKAERDGNRKVSDAVKAITPQAWGSASTYACRIALRSLVVVASEAAEEDDDGNAASALESPVGKFQDVVVKVESETRKGRNQRDFTIHRIRTGKHGELATFDLELADAARRIAGSGQVADMEGKKNDRGFGYDIVSLMPIQGQSPAQGPQAPATAKEEAPAQATPAEPAQAPQGAPTAPEEVFVSPVLDTNKKEVAGRPTMYAIKTEKGWLMTADGKIHEAMAKIKGAGFTVEFTARRQPNGSKHYDLLQAVETAALQAEAAQALDKALPDEGANAPAN
jgi:hypothetical protein